MFTYSDLTVQAIVNLIASLVYCLSGGLYIFSSYGIPFGTRTSLVTSRTIPAAISILLALGQMGLSYDFTPHQRYLPPVYSVAIIIISTSIIVSSLLMFDCCCDGDEGNTTTIGRVASDSTQIPTVFIVSNCRKY